MDEHAHEFLLVLSYLKTADLLQVSKTCHAMHDLLAPTSPFWLRHSAEMYPDYEQASSRYLLTKGVLHRSFFFLEDEQYTKCCFCLCNAVQMDPFDLSEFPKKNMFLVNQCDARRCNGYANWILEFLKPYMIKAFEIEFSSIGLDAKDFPWVIEMTAFRTIYNNFESASQPGVYKLKSPAVVAAESIVSEQITGDHWPYPFDDLIRSYDGQIEEEVFAGGRVVVFKWPWQSPNIGVLECCPCLASTRNIPVLKRLGSRMVPSVLNPEMLVFNVKMDDLRAFYRKTHNED